MSDLDYSANRQRFGGIADTYNSYRPHPPQIIPTILSQLVGMERPALVVDLGCGTGLSTVLWADHAEKITGIEPSDDMRQRARSNNAAPNIEYRAGYGHGSGLPDACADIVTCSQSFHWMEPQSTLKEAARILRPGGLFAAYDNDWPPTVHPEVDAAYLAAHNIVHQLEMDGNLRGKVLQWPKSEHLNQIRSSGLFRFTREFCVHHSEPGDADRMAGLLLSQGSTGSLIKHGYTEEQVGVAALRATAQRVMGPATWTFYWTYRVRLGVK